MSISTAPTDFSQGSGSGTVTILHSCSFTHSILVVQIGDFVGSDVESATSITYNGVALTLAGSHAYNTARVSFWYLISPSAGPHNLVITCGSTITVRATTWHATDVNDVISVGSIVTNTGLVSVNGQPISGSITGLANGIVLAHCGILTDTITDNAGQNGIAPVSSGGFFCQAAYKTGATGATTIGWTNYTADNRWAVIAFQINVQQSLSLTSARGSFAETGEAAGLSRGVVMTCTPNSPASLSPLESFRKITRLSSVGSFADTGESAAFSIGYTLVADTVVFSVSSHPGNGGLTFRKITRSSSAGSYVLTGEDAELDPALFGRESTGSYALTGENAGLLVGRTLTAASGSYALEGEDAAFSKGKGLAGDTGSFTVTGEDATSHVSLHLTADHGSFIVDGQLIAFPVTLSILAGRGTFVVNGRDAALLYHMAGATDYSLDAEAGGYELDGDSPVLRVVRSRPSGGGGGGFGGLFTRSRTRERTETVTERYGLVASAGELSVTGLDAELRVTYGPPESTVFSDPLPIPIPPPTRSPARKRTRKPSVPWSYLLPTETGSLAVRPGVATFWRSNPLQRLPEPVTALGTPQPVLTRPQPGTVGVVEYATTTAIPTMSTLPAAFDESEDLRLLFGESLDEWDGDPVEDLVLLGY